MHDRWCEVVTLKVLCVPPQNKGQKVYFKIMKKHLSLEVKRYSSFHIATAGCLLMLALLILWTESSWCQNYEKYWSSRLLAWWQLLIGALYVLRLVPGRLRRYPVWLKALFVLSSVWQTGTLCCNSLPYKLKRIRLRTYTQSVRWMASSPSCFHCSMSVLSLIAGDSTGTCGDPGTPAHASREAGNFKVRSKVRFTCAVGHTLYGSAERICFPNGTWSGKQPFCKRKRNL